MCRPMFPSRNPVAEQWGGSKVSNLLSQPQPSSDSCSAVTDQCLHGTVSNPGPGGSQRAPSKRMDTEGYVKLTVQQSRQTRGINPHTRSFCDPSAETAALSLRYNSLLEVIAQTLKDLLKALKGLVVMSSQLELMANSLYNNSVPTVWNTKVTLPNQPRCPQEFFSPQGESSNPTAGLGCLTWNRLLRFARVSCLVQGLLSPKLKESLGYGQLSATRAQGLGFPLVCIQRLPLRVPHRPTHH